MTRFLLGVLGNDQVEEQSRLLQFLRADMIISVNNSTRTFPSLSAFGNELHRIAQAGGFAAFGLIHADVDFSTRGIDRFFLESAVTHGRIAGIVGAYAQKQYLWANMMTEDRTTSTVDSCAIFVPMWFTTPNGEKVHNTFLFDQDEFNSFHLCVEDYCLQVYSALGISPIVPYTVSSVGHRGGSTYAHNWQHEYRYYKDKFCQKWKNTPFFTT